VWRIRELAREGEWALPATHLMIHEDPAQAAVRIAKRWGGVTDPHPRLVGIDSCRLPTGLWKGSGRTRRRVYHWAIGFVYELTTLRPRKKDPGWAELRFVPTDQLRSLRIGRGHRDFLKYLTPSP